MKTKVIVVLALQLTTLVIADSIEDENSLEHLEGKLTRAMDELNEKGTIDIYGNVVTLERVADDGRSSEGSADPLVSRIERFLRTRKIQINFPDGSSTADLFRRALGQRNINIELRGLTQGASEARMKLKRMILPLMVLMELIALFTLPIAVTTIGLIGIKGIGVSFLALVLSSAIALAGLFTPPPPPKVSYSIIRPHDIHHDHWHRSEQEIDTPYKSWAPEHNDEQYLYHDVP